MDEISLYSGYKVISLLGKGAFASVYLAQHIATHTPVAIKIIPKKNVHHKETLVRELELIKQMKHPLIVKYFEIRENDTKLLIIMEYIAGKTLLDIINATQIDEDTAKRIFSQLISVIDYCHNVVHCVHRDLKPENIIIDQNGNMKLIDFGLGRSIDTAHDGVMQTRCGSIAYVAPELISGNGYTQSVDIWSCGVVLYAMMTQTLPFNDESSNVNTIMQKIIKEDPVLAPNFSSSLANLIFRLLEKNPDNRITIQEIINHPWFSIRDFQFAGLIPLETMDDHHCEAVLQQMELLNIPTNDAGTDLETESAVAYRILYRQFISSKMSAPTRVEAQPYSTPNIIVPRIKAQLMRQRHQTILLPNIRRRVAPAIRRCSQACTKINVTFD